MCAIYVYIDNTSHRGRAHENSIKYMYIEYRVIRLYKRQGSRENIKRKKKCFASTVTGRKFGVLKCRRIFTNPKSVRREKQNT